MPHDPPIRHGMPPLSDEEIAELIAEHLDDMFPSLLERSLKAAVKGRPPTPGLGRWRERLPADRLERWLDSFRTDDQLMRWLHRRAPMGQAYTLLFAYEVFYETWSGGYPTAPDHEDLRGFVRVQLSLVPGRLQTARMAVATLRQMAASYRRG